MLKKKLTFEILLIIILIPLFYLISSQDYLLFHTIVELISIIVAFSLFSIAWNSRQFSRNNYLLFLGISFFFIGSIDLLHTISYKGMNIFLNYDSNLPTQLWISARYLESISLIAASYFIKKKFNINLLLTVYFLVFIIINFLIFNRLFPVCFVEGVGLTVFKKVSEYIISIFLLFALWRAIKLKDYFLQRIRWMIYLAIIFTIFSEIAFTFYISVYGLSNFIGHIFKLISFYLIYKALLVTGLKQPYKMLFNELHESESRYRKAQEIGLVGNWEFNIKTKEFWGSDEAKRIYGFDPEIKNFPADEVYQRVIEKDRVHQALVDLIEKEKPYDLEFEIISQNSDHKKTIHSIAELEKDNSGKPSKVSGVVIDITKSKQAESALKDSEARFKSLTNDVLDNLEVGVFILSSEFKIVWINRTIENFFGIRRDQVLGKDKKQLILEEIQNIFEDPDAFKQKVFATYENNKYIEKFTCVIKKSADLQPRILEHYSQPISEGLFQGGRIEYYYDITKNKQAEAKITNLLQEKEILLREVHHRIKNNMATIISLLKLHSREIASESARAALQDAIGRIRLMKVLYDKLYRSDNFQEIESQSYFIPLIKEIIAVFPKSENVEIVNKVQNFTINAKLVLPLGIIINELIANIMKYAFQDDTNNQIIVQATKEQDLAKLVIQDNGVGLDQDSLKHSEGFGHQLIEMMTDQINGKIDIENGNGTKFILQFKCVLD